MAASAESNTISTAFDLIGVFLARNLDHVALNIFRNLDFFSLRRASRTSAVWRRFILDNLLRLSSKDGKDVIIAHAANFDREEENDDGGYLPHLVGQMTDREVLGLDKDRLSANVCIHGKIARDVIYAGLTAYFGGRFPGVSKTFDDVFCQCLYGYALRHEATDADGTGRKEKIVLLKNGSKDGSRTTKEVLTLWETGQRFQGGENALKDFKLSSFRILPIDYHYSYDVFTYPLMINKDRAFIVASLLFSPDELNGRRLSYYSKVILEGVMINLRTETVLWRKRLGGRNYMLSARKNDDLRDLDHCRPFLMESFCGLVFTLDGKTHVHLQGLTADGNLGRFSEATRNGEFDKMAVGRGKLAVLSKHEDSSSSINCWLIDMTRRVLGKLESVSTLPLEIKNTTRKFFMAGDDDRFLVCVGQPGKFVLPRGGVGTVRAWDLKRNEIFFDRGYQSGSVLKGVVASGHFWVVEDEKKNDGSGESRPKMKVLTFGMSDNMRRYLLEEEQEK